MSAIVENLSELPQQEVEEVVLWALTEMGVNRRWVSVRVTQTDHWHHHGRFTITEDPLSVLLTAEVPRKPSKRKYDRRLKYGPPGIRLNTWQESLVCIVAHEAMHLRQFAQEEDLIEVEAEWAEYHLLDRWREERNHEYAYSGF